MWLAVWPGVATASTATVAGDHVAVGQHDIRAEIAVGAGVERLRLADIERPRGAVRAFAEVFAPVAALMRGAAGEWSRWVWVTKMCVTVSPRTASSSAAICCRIVRAGIDDRDLAAADDVAHRALEGERARIVGERADAGHEFLRRRGQDRNFGRR